MRSFTDGQPFALAVTALAVGGFALGTGEFMVMGLLPEMARDLDVSLPGAGRVVSAYALGVVIGAPLLAVLGAGRGRRGLLLALMAWTALSDFATALTPGQFALLGLRWLCGLPHAAYFGVAALVAVSLAPPQRRAGAVGLLMSGLALASLCGTPLAVWLGQCLGWRAAFVMAGGAAALAWLLIRRYVPDLPVAGDAHPLRELGALARPQVWLTLATGAVGFGAMFAVLAYVAPLLTEAGGLPETMVAPVLALFGAGMVVGNLIGARMADRALTPSIAALLAWSALVSGAFAYSAPHVAALCANVFLLGTTVAIGPALQVRLMDVAGNAQTLAAALNHAAFNLANALGAWLGGAVVAAGFGWTATGPAGAALALAGLVLFGVAVLSGRRRSAQ